MAGPLQGIRIVDTTSMIAGPLAKMVLGDQGADVIKVENPKGGDHSRQVAGRRMGWSQWLIEDLLTAKASIVTLAARLGRHRSTVYREIKRNRFVDDEDHELLAA